MCELCLRAREKVKEGDRKSGGEKEIADEEVKFMLINHVVSSTVPCLSPAVSGVWGLRYRSHIQTHTHINKDDRGLLLPEISCFYPPLAPLSSSIRGDVEARDRASLPFLFFCFVRPP